MEGKESLEDLAGKERAIVENNLDWLDFYPVIGVISLKNKARDNSISSWQAFYMTAWHYGIGLAGIRAVDLIIH